MVIIIASVAAGLAVAFVLIAALAHGKRQQSVSQRITTYGAEGPRRKGGGPDTKVQTKVLQGAVDVTEKLATRYGILGRVSLMLEQADVPLRPAEVLFFYLIAVSALFVAGWVLSGFLIAGVVLALVGAAIPPLVLTRKAKKKLQNFEDQLPDTLKLLASTLRSGFSLMQGLEHLAKESGEPARTEFQTVFNEVRLGRPPEQAMREVAERMQSVDLMWTVMAIQIQREIGGNLAELLDTVADTMLSRAALRREIKALTAEGRISGYVLGAFPFVMGAALTIIQPKLISLLFTTMAGIIMIVAAVFAAFLGTLWIRKILAIEV